MKDIRRGVVIIMVFAAKKFFGVFALLIVANIIFVSSLEGDVRWVATRALHEQIAGSTSPVLSVSEAAALIDFSLNNPNADTSIFGSQYVGYYESGLDEFTKRSREVYAANKISPYLPCDTDDECTANVGEGYYCYIPLSSFNSEFVGEFVTLENKPVSGLVMLTTYNDFLTPSGGEQWKLGTTQSISWAGRESNCERRIELFYQKVGETNRHSIVYKCDDSYQNTNDKFYYSWTIPSSLTPGIYHLIAESIKDGGVYRTSVSNNFTLVSDCYSESFMPVIPYASCCPGQSQLNSPAGTLEGVVCTAKCGDGVCASDLESSLNCPQDCVAKKGLCVPKAPEVECNYDADCAEGYVCSENNTCVEALSQECIYYTDCEEGLICSEDSLCEQCTSNEECSDTYGGGYTCDAGDCVEREILCRSDQECIDELGDGFVCDYLNPYNPRDISRIQAASAGPGGESYIPEDRPNDPIGVCIFCSPLTCTGLGAQCGTVGDGCGRNLSCGSCSSDKFCGADNVCYPGQQNQINCTDTDNGKNYVLKGTAALNGGSSATDSCISNSTLTEYFCSIVNGVKSISSESKECSLVAGSSSVCSNGACICTPSCSGRVCGDNGCGGNCGNCNSTSTCNSAGQCIRNCVPKTCSQLGKQCGMWNNTCGGIVTCPSCTYGNCINGTCVIEQPGCVPQSNSTTCASAQCDKVNNCGDVVDCPQSCSAGYVCSTSSGMCLRSCVRNCQGKQCGDDGCGGVCGSCNSGYTCSSNNLCVLSGNEEQVGNINFDFAGIDTDSLFVGQKGWWRMKSSDTGDLTYTIDYGDGSVPGRVMYSHVNIGSNGAEFTHTYTNPGTYNVVMIVSAGGSYHKIVEPINVLSQPALTSVVANYNFNEGAGIVAYDKSGYNNDAIGCYRGAVCINRFTPGAWVSGKTGTGLKGAGQVPYDPSHDTGTFRIEASIKPLVDLNSPYVGGTRTIVSKSGVYDLRFHSIDPTYGRVLQATFFLPRDHADFYNAADYNTYARKIVVPFSDWGIQKDRWSDLKFEFDGRVAKLYVDGVLKNTTTLDSNVGSYRFFGESIQVGDGGGDLVVDDIKITSLSPVVYDFDPVINNFTCPSTTMVDEPMRCFFKTSDAEDALIPGPNQLRNIISWGSGEHPGSVIVWNVSGGSSSWSHVYTRADNPHRDRQKTITFTVQDSAGHSVSTNRQITILWPPNIPPQFSNFQGPVDMLANESFGTWSVKVINPEGPEGSMGQTVAWVKVDYGDGSPLESQYYKNGDVYSFGMHKYKSTGNYALTFIAQDGNGDTNSTSYNIRVHLSEKFNLGDRVSTRVNAGSFSSIVARSPTVRFPPAGKIGTVTAGPLYTYNVDTAYTHYLYARDVWWWMVNFTGADAQYSGWMWEDDLTKV